MAKRQRNKVNNKRKHETLMKENDKTLTDRVILERKSDRGMSYNPTTSTAHTSSSPEFQLPPPATFHDPDHTNHIEKEMEAPTKINTNFEDLPQDLIHSIMNYLPCKDAFRLGVSSKAFYSLWLSNPVLHFDNRSFVRDEEEEDEDESEDDDDEDESEDEEDEDESEEDEDEGEDDGDEDEDEDEDDYNFFSFIRKTLQLRRPHINKSLKNLCLHYYRKKATSDHDNFYQTVLDSLLDFAVENHCREMVLHILLTMPGLTLSAENNYLIDVSHNSILPLFSSEFLTYLSLSGLRIPIADPIILCPKLESLEIFHCQGLKTLTISSQSLEKVEICGCIGLEGVELKGKKISTFIFQGIKVNELEPYDEISINLSACESVENVILLNTKLSENFLTELATEYLFITFCDLPENLRIENPNIRQLSISDSDDKLENLFLSAINLEHFIYESQQRPNCTLNISACVALTHLTLKGATITDEWLKSTISNLDCLKSVTISECNSLEKIGFENNRLECLCLAKCFNLKEVIVDVPNLLKFAYQGNLQVYPIQILSSTKFRTEITLMPEGNIDPLSWFGNMKQFLSCFQHIKDLSINRCKAQDMIFPKKFLLENNPCPLHNLKYMKLQMMNNPKGQTAVKLVESLLWLAPKPLQLTLTDYMDRTKTLKFEYGEKLERTRARCCLEVPIKCWRHYELKVDIQGFNHCGTRRLRKFFATP